MKQTIQLFIIFLCSPFAFSSQEVIPLHFDSEGWHQLYEVPDNASTILPIKKLDEKIFSKIYRVWEPKEKAIAESLDEVGRKKMAFKRYGMVADPTRELPYGFFNKNNKLAFNCMGCHVGQINGQPVLGVPNRNLSMKTFLEDLAKYYPMIGNFLKTKIKMFPEYRGLFPTIVFSNYMSFMFRNKNMRITKIFNPRKAPEELYLPETAVNPPAMFGVHKKKLFGNEAWNPGHETLVANIIDAWDTKKVVEKKFETLHTITEFTDYLDSPDFEKLSGQKINHELANQGKVIFNRKYSCSGCHGKHGEDWTEPHPIPVSVVKTDPVRALNPLQIEMRKFISETRMGDGKREEFVTDTKRYMAMQLNGIWATAPYFHNGSVPTIRAIFYPNERPKIWRAEFQDYDFKNLGLVYEEFDKIPQNLSSWERRYFYDTTVEGSGKSNSGHTGVTQRGSVFPDQLNEEEKQAVMEYLKTI